MAGPIGRRDERLDDWLRGELGDAFLRYDALTAMTMALARERVATVVPPDVMTAWHKEIAACRRAVAQSEEQFINEARRQGWTWDRIAAVLGLENAHAAMSRLAVLRSELERTHPSRIPIPWTG